LARKADGLPTAERDALVRALIDKYEIDPTAVQRALPELAQSLEVLIHKRGRGGTWEMFQLTPTEEQERWRFYRRVLQKLNRGKIALSQEEAIEALEDVAALRGARFGASTEMEQGDILKLLRIATGLSLSKKGTIRKHTVRDMPPAKSISAVRGVTLYLTWDKKLVSVEVNPKELKLRDRALKFVGIGQDREKDVAARHNDYLAGDLSNA